MEGQSIEVLAMFSNQLGILNQHRSVTILLGG